MPQYVYFFGGKTADGNGKMKELLGGKSANLAEMCRIGLPVPAGFIDGPGPYEGPIKVLAATSEEAKQRVDRYAELGYEQIKIYSSVNPVLVPVIAQEAHRRVCA